MIFANARIFHRRHAASPQTGATPGKGRAFPRPSRRDGFVLPASLMLMLVATIIIGYTFSYVMHVTRMTRYYTAQTRCRLAAQSAIEDAKAKIQSGFSKYTGGASAATVRVDPKVATAFNWFDEVSPNHLTIGNGLPQAVTLTSPQTINGCTVYLGIGKKVDHVKNSSIAKVPLVATAVFNAPGGLKVEATIQERVCFATGQSKVFDYAYFVNNYGWMTGSSIIINGDMRANGNVSVSQSTVNGFIYAAANDELGVDGEVTLSSAKIWSQSYYRSNSGNRARTDIGEWDRDGSYAAPATSTSGSGYYGYGGSSSSTTLTLSKTTATARNAAEYIVNEGADSIPMPFVSELNDYVEFAREKNGTLSYPAFSYTDTFGTKHSTPAGTVSAHHSGTGPSGDATLADKGAIVLVGTQSNPIVVNGPVVIDSDVIIKGYVRGQGTIYSGRNIHIVGDIKYVNPPNWSHSGKQATAQAEYTANTGKDLLGLVAKGNIVLGDCSSSSWHTSVDSYINGGNSSVVEEYVCDPSDNNIGYPSDYKFCGSYTAEEDAIGGKNNKLKVRPAEVKLGTYHTVQTPKYDRWGRVTGYTTTQVEDTVKKLANIADRHYYETVCDDAILTALKDSAGISQIDAVLYNNHGIFGAIGKNNAKFNLNGSIVCRDEGLIATTGNGIVFNWDMRLKPDDSGLTDSLGLPVGPNDPFTASWQQVPASLNPVYQQQTAPKPGDRR